MPRVPGYTEPVWRVLRNLRAPDRIQPHSNPDRDSDKDTMLTRKNLIQAVALLLAVFGLRSAHAADARDRVLRQLDAASARFHTTSAQFEFDTVTTEPIPDTDRQKGTVYYERNGSSFRMAAHIEEQNGKKSPKMYVYSGGSIKLYEPLIDQVTTLQKLSQYESWFMLGFGASGKELEKKWEIKYLGSDILEGKKAEKLEMVAKDPAVRKNIVKVQMWVDPETGISLKQVFDQGAGQYRVSVYFNIQVNQPLPGDAFTLKTTKKTVFVNR